MYAHHQNSGTFRSQRNPRINCRLEDQWQISIVNLVVSISITSSSYLKRWVSFTMGGTALTLGRFLSC